MISDKDIIKLKKVFATKEDLKELNSKVETQGSSLHDDITTFKDQIMYELSKIRDDLTIVVGYRDMIEDHETRINRLEVKA